MSPISTPNMAQPATSAAASAAASAAEGVDAGTASDTVAAAAAFAELLRRSQAGAKSVAGTTTKVAATGRLTRADPAAGIADASDPLALQAKRADCDHRPAADPRLGVTAPESALAIAAWVPPSAQSGAAAAESLTASIFAQRAQSGLAPAEVALTTALSARPGGAAAAPAGAFARADWPADASAKIDASVDSAQGFSLAPALGSAAGVLSQAMPRAGPSDGTAQLRGTLTDAANDPGAAPTKGADAGGIGQSPAPALTADTGIVRPDPGAWAAQAVAVDAAALRSSASTAHSIAIDAAVGTPRFTDETAQQVTWMAKNGIEQAEIRVKPAELGPISVRIEMNQGEAIISFAVTQAETRVAVEDALHRLQEMLAESGISLGQTSVGGQEFGQTSRDGGAAHRSRITFPGSATPGAGVDNLLPTPPPRRGSGRGMVDTFA